MSEKLAILPDHAGYTLGERAVFGFDDNELLPSRQRRRIAQWAKNFGTPTSEQLAMLDRGTSPQQSDAQAQANDLASVWRSPVFSLLSKSEQDLIRDPAQALDGRGYPLTIGALATLTNATTRQIRHWSNLGLLPATRNSRNDRLYGPAAAMRACWFARHGQDAVTTLSQYVNPEKAGSLLAMVASMLHEHAADYGTPQEPINRLVEQMETVSLQLATAEPVLTHAD